MLAVAYFAALLARSADRWRARDADLDEENDYVIVARAEAGELVSREGLAGVQRALDELLSDDRNESGEAARQPDRDSAGGAP